MGGPGCTAGLGWRPGSTLGVELVGHRLVALELRDRLRLRGVEVGGLIQAKSNSPGSCDDEQFTRSFFFLFQVAHSLPTPSRLYTIFRTLRFFSRPDRRVQTCSPSTTFSGCLTHHAQE